MAADTDDKSDKRGKHWGRYQIIDRIASGGMGAVYKALDPDDNRVVALKVMTPELTAKPIMKERFRREARAAAKLQHENIVAIHEFGEVDGVFFLALEFIDGKDLHDYIAQSSGGRLKPEEARLITLQAARALDHAHQAGVIHRDIKPSNFLVLTGEGTPLVKLTDMGLARQENDDENRVTKAGMTLGTVDYMAPEQARDSGKADIRSDIYALGCTLFHMLAGRPPFPKGSMAERLVHHIQSEPPDICKINDAVPRALARILSKMIAKKPRDRYQTPAELIQDLLNPERARFQTAPAPEPAPEKKARKEPAPPSSVVASVRKRGKKTKSPAWLPYAIGGGVLVVVGIVVLIIVNSRRSPPEVKKAEEPQVVEKKVEPPPPPPPQVVGPPAPQLPKLYEPLLPLDAAALHKEFYGGFGPFPETPAGATTIVVSRLPLAGTPSVGTLAEALAQMPPGPAIIEIRDQGPHFLLSLPPVAGRDLWIRGGAGQRPLLAWDGRGGDSLLTLAKGDLTLENLDVVVGGAERKSPATLFLVRGGNFQARACTFSVAGTHAGGVHVAKLQGQTARTASTAVQNIAGEAKARFTRCYLRGNDMTALSTDNTPADILVEETLAVGGSLPLLDHRNTEEEALTVRIVRSTLTVREQLWRWQNVAGKGGAPRLKGFTWDAIFARTDTVGPGGDLLELTGGATANLVSVKPVNCLYAGWKRLLASADKNCATLESWRSHMGHTEGDAFQTDAWPRSALGPLEDLAAANLYPHESSAGFAATQSSGVIGCEIGRLPPEPYLWQQRTFERLVTVPPSAVEADSAEIPNAPEGLYHGERIEVGKIDLGQHLAARLQTLKPGPRVVLRLIGKGVCITSPVKLRGIEQVVIRFEQPATAAKDKSEPLTLELKQGAGAVPAMVDVEGGSLEIQNGRFRLENSKLSILPTYLVRVRGGDLRLQQTTLIGPLSKTPDSFQSLIGCDGAGFANPTPTNVVLRDCVLESGRSIVELKGAGARLGCRGSLLYSLGDALVFDLGNLFSTRTDVAALLENNTIALRQGFVQVRSSDAPPGCQPVVVQTKANYFLDPSPDPSRQACVFRSNGETLGRGLFLWQGQGNVFARDRLAGYYGAADLPVAKQSLAEWLRFVGPVGETAALPVDALPAKTFNLDAPTYDRLALPPSVRLEPAPGADLAKLRLVKKK